MADRTIAIMDVATAFLQNDKFKKDELNPPLVSDGGDDEYNDETFDRKEGFDDNLTSHDSSINTHEGREAGQNRESATPRVTNDEGSRTDR